MKFQNSTKLRTSDDANSILDLVEEEFEKVAESVERLKNEIKVTSIEASFGSINRNDVSRVYLKQKPGGYTLVSETEYKPSTSFWIFLVLGVIGYLVFSLVPIVFYLVQKKTVQSAIDDVFRRIDDEVDTGEGPVGQLMAPQVSQQPASASAPPAEPSVDNSLNQLEQLARLRDSGVIDESDFQFKKRQLLGINDGQPAQEVGGDREQKGSEIESVETGREGEESPAVYIRRSGKVSGPFPSEQVRAARTTGKVRESDELSLSENGPWVSTEEFLE